MLMPGTPQYKETYCRATQYWNQKDEHLKATDIILRESKPFRKSKLLT